MREHYINMILQHTEDDMTIQELVDIANQVGAVLQGFEEKIHTTYSDRLD